MSGIKRRRSNFSYRDHRGTLAASLKTTRRLTCYSDLTKYVNLTYGEGEVTVRKHGLMDDRCGWDTHLVLIDNKAVGMVDRMVSALDDL